MGRTFPSAVLEDVHGKEYASESLFGRQWVLVGIGTSQKAEDQLRTWQVPVYNKFVAKTGLMDGMYDVKVWFVPLFTGASQAAKPKVVKKLRENNEALVIDHLLIYSGAREPFREMGIDDRSEPYFLLFDRSGKVRWMASGAFKPKHLEQIAELLSNED
jgi:hypothetical protein